MNWSRQRVPAHATRSALTNYRPRSGFDPHQAVAVLTGLVLVCALASVAVGGAAAAPDTSATAFDALENDSHEPNDDYENATVLDGNTSITNLSVSATDPDILAVSLAEYERLTVTVSGPQPSTAPFIRLENSQHQRVDSDQLGGESVELTAVTAEPRTYYIDVSNVYSGPTSYSLSTNVTPVPTDDALEPNDDIANATPIEAGTTVSDVRLFDENPDYYAVNLTRGEQLVTTYEHDEEFVYPQLHAIGPSGDYISYAYDTPSGSEMLVNADVNGTYHLKFARYGRDDVQPYSFTTTVRDAPPDDAYEPSDGPASAPTIEAGATLTNLSWVPTDQDFYNVTLRAGERFRVAFGDNETGESLRLRVSNPDGYIVDDPTTQTDQTVSFTAAESGTYTIGVVRDYRDGDDLRRIPYSLTTSVRAPLSNDELEPNNDREQATPLDPNQTRSDLRLTPGDQDYFAVELRRSEELRVSIEHDAGSSRSGPYVYGPSEYYEPRTTVGENQTQFVFHPPRNGTYYVAVDRWAFDLGAAETLRYSITAAVRPISIADEYEPNDRIETATPIPANETLDDLQIRRNETDIYSVDVPENGTLNASVVFEHPTGARVSIRDEAGNVLDERGGSHVTTVRPTLRVLDGGTYYLVVESQSLSPSWYTLRAAGAVPEEGQTVWIAPSNTTTGIGTTQTFDVVMSAPEGIEAQVFNVSLTNGSVARFTNVSIPGNPTVGRTAITSPADTVAVESGYLRQSRNASSRLTIATVTVEGTAIGSTELELGNVEIAGEANRRYALRGAAGATLSVTDSTGMTLSGQSQPAASLDGDSLLEDVNGDGEGDIFDAIAYYNHRRSDIITSHPDQFDFDGDDEAGTIFDAIALYNDLS